MPVSDGNIGFNDITQEIYGRVPQAGDNLKQMFEDSPASGFDPLYDIGSPGPGDAMSEYKGFVRDGIFSGTWENFYGYRVPYVPDSVWQKYFSEGDLQINVQVKYKTDSGIPEEEASFDAPITATLTIGGVEITTTDQSQGVGDDILFKITAADGIPDGTYFHYSDIIVTLKDSSGYIVNAETYSGNIDIFPQALHIYGKGFSTYRWQWSVSATDSYPIVYPSATWTITTPTSGVVPGTSSPSINLKITDFAGFSDITAEIILWGPTKQEIIGSETTGYVGIGSAFKVNVNKQITFNVDVLRDYIDVPNDVLSKDWRPSILLRFGGGLSTIARQDTNFPVYVYRYLTVTPDNFSWDWYNTDIDPNDLLIPTDDLGAPGGEDPIDPLPTGGGGGAPSEDDTPTKDDLILQ